MKKLIAIIMILIVILVGMIVYKKVVIKTSNVSIQEIEKVEKYLEQIYMWKEVTGEALPCFEEINQANEMWIWEVVKKNLEDYELSYKQIQEKAKELFGENFTKEFPKEGTKYLIYEEENNLYYAVGMGLDQQDDVFLFNKIERTENGYEVEIVEYLEDYSQSFEEENQIIIRNLEGEVIGKISNEKEEQAKEIAKNNIDKLSKKKVRLRVENEKLYVEKIYQ